MFNRLPTCDYQAMLDNEHMRGRLREAFATSDVTQREVAAAFGITEQAVSGWLRTGKIDKRKLPTVAKMLGVPLTYFMPDAEPSNVAPGPAIRGTVPLISWVQAGDFTEVQDPLQPGEGERIPTTAPIHEHTFALRVEGDSMMPTFPPGTILIIEPDAEPHPGSYVVAKNGGDATFKQLTRDGGTLYLKPLNSQYPTKPLGDSRIIGVVVKSEKDWT